MAIQCKINQPPTLLQPISKTHNTFCVSREALRSRAILPTQAGLFVGLASFFFCKPQKKHLILTCQTLPSLTYALVGGFTLSAG